MAGLDHIASLSEAHARSLAEALQSLFGELLDSIDANAIGISLDDIDADHIRSQIELIFERTDDGVPAAFAQGMQRISDMLESFVAAVAAHAASEVSHTLNTSDFLLSEAKAEAREFAASIITQTAVTISGTIESAIYGRGSTRARADQVRRAVGLSDSQVNALDRMQETLQRYVEAPRRYYPASVDSNGIRTPGEFRKRISTAKLLAATRGHVSAAQARMLARALGNPKLKQQEVTKLLDDHAAALRAFRLNAVSAQVVHQLAESAKVAGWRIAQRSGVLPSDQRRFWKTAGDERVRHTHSQVPAMNPQGVLLDQPFATPFGPRMGAPLEWGCRCTAVLRKPR